MLSETQKQIVAKQVEAMPARIREAMEHIDTTKYLKALTEKYGLRTDEAQVLENEIMIIMLGLEKPEAFIRHLTQAGISKETAAGLVADVNRDVFEKIRHDLMEFLQKTTNDFGENIDTSDESPITKFERERAGKQEMGTSEPAPAIIMPKAEAPAITENKEATPLGKNTVAGDQNVAPATPTPAPAQNQPPTPAALTNDFAKARMEQTVRMPDVKKYPGVDPYREPVK